MGDDIMEQAMVVVFPQEDPKVCQVSFRPGVPLLILQSASIESGRMTFGDRSTVDLRRAKAVVADGEKVCVLGQNNGSHPHVILELHMDDNAEIQAWTTALRQVLGTPGLQGLQSQGGPAGTSNAKAVKNAPSKDEQLGPPGSLQSTEISEQADEECSLLRAKSQKLQQRISTLEMISDRREKQMKRLLKRLDGAMQMLEALEDMLEQQRRAIAAQKAAISALKEEGAVDEEEEEEEVDPEDVSPEKLMALFQQAEQMERALKQIESLGKAGLLEGGPGEDGDVDAILSRLHALEEEKANFERMVAQSK